MVQVACPGCNVRLRVPDECIGKTGRCRICGKLFPIVAPQQPPHHDSVEDTVVDWLDNSRHQPASEPQSATAQIAQPKVSQIKPVTVAAQAAATSAGTRHSYDVRLDHLDAMGAFLHFDPRLLFDEDFRASFPQQCILCGSQTHLSVYLVNWSSKLIDKTRGNAQPSKRCIQFLDQLGDTQGRQLLAKLPRVENLPEPYCLPMPYYVCDNCSPLGAMMAAVHASSAGAGDECVLGISSLVQAEALVQVLRGENCEEARRIRERRADHTDSWRMLPLTIRVRIAQWFKPKEGERFLSYIPDLEFSKTEAGLAGLVITDRRVIYRRAGSAVEMSLRDPITLQFRPEGANMKLQLNAGPEKHVTLLTSDTCVQQLRQILAKHRK